MPNETVVNALQGIDACLVQAFNEYALPGLAVGIVHEGKLVYSRTFGYANLETETPIRLDTIFRIMSISKTFTAIGVMQLWEQGRFQLDDPVNQYLKAMQVCSADTGAPPITFRHLLTHTAGIGEMRGLSDMLRPVGGLGARPDTRILSMPEYYGGRLRAEIRPGLKWAYANHGYAVLAQLIEDISGQPFAQYMREHVFEPLGMQHSDYFMSERVHAVLPQEAPTLTQGYEFKHGRFKPVDYLRLNTPGCGGIFSNVNDMVKYVSALMDSGRGQGGSILRPETLEMMMSPQLSIDPRLFGMGFGFVLGQVGPYRLARHGGGWPGFISEMAVIPEQKLAVLTFTNSSSRAPGIIAKMLLHRLLGLPDPVEAVPNPGILEDVAGWERLCGSYGPRPGFLTNWRVWEGYGGEVEVFVKGGHLMLRGLTGPNRKGFPLYRADPEDPLLFVGKTGRQLTPVLFEADAGGRIRRLNIAQYAFDRRPFRRSLRFKATAALGALGGVVLFFIGRKWVKGHLHNQEK